MFTGVIVLTILYCLIPVTLLDEDVNNRMNSIRDSLDEINTFVNNKDKQIKHLQMALLKSQMNEERSKQEIENITDVIEKNIKLEKAVLSLKDVIHESGLKIMELESKHKEDEKMIIEKDAIIENMREEISQDRMYKVFFEKVISHLRTLNTSEYNFEITFGSGKYVDKW